MITRKETTKLLSDLLIRDVLVSNGYWSSETTLRIGTKDECRVDFMKFVPANQSPSGIEHGKFTAYEVKSCLDDYNSGHGLNFVGDLNYIVCPMSLFKQLPQGVTMNGHIGFYVPVPNNEESRKLSQTDLVYREYKDPTPLTANLDEWRLHCHIRANSTDRYYSLSELLFCMMRSGR